ncbi:T9SS type A sorting domain-containing protein [Polaribacter sp. Z022]|uniref:T9SS type A sorting domain-containing protein n=1 Tax=Polaribacter sp. Z022 TaxID=2927125 RepID=UPI002020270A|nr:T9SS type A sorting domain-containing protein [Polaribacter sp. Z022]MCL7753140.1 T9SS type A sorting domain-containing protein [Polaribacter sp. Z022]
MLKNVEEMKICGGILRFKLHYILTLFVFLLAFSSSAQSIKSGVTFQWNDIQTAGNQPATIKSITINGDVYDDFRAPSSYVLTQLGPAGNDASNNIRENSVQLETTSASATWNASALTAFQDRNLTHYFEANGNGDNICNDLNPDLSGTQIQTLVFTNTITSESSILVVTERNANNCLYIKIYGVPNGGGPEQLLGTTYVIQDSTSWGFGGTGSSGNLGTANAISAPNGASDYWLADRVVESNANTAGIALFEMENIVPIGSNITKIEFIAATSDHGDGKVFVLNKNSDGDGADNEDDLDDDNDGILDVEERNCSNTTAAPANSVFNKNGVNNSNDILDSNLNIGAEFNAVNDEIIIDLGEYIPTGTTLKFDYFASNTASKTITIEQTTFDGLTNTNTETITKTTTAAEDLDYVLTEPTKYIRILMTADSGGTLEVSYLEIQPFQKCTDKDTDGDLLPDHLDTDADGDGCPDALEANGGIVPSQLDSTGAIDISITGVDSNGVPNAVSGGQSDVSSTNANIESSFCDYDGDGIPESTDIDDDNDGILDITESGGNNPDGDEDGDGTSNYLDTTDNGDSGDGSTTNYIDNDSNGIPDVYDTDGDGIPNHRDIDTDNDGIPDNIEAQTTSGYVAPSGNDTDNDGLDDAYDSTVNGNADGTGSLGLIPVNTDGIDNPDYLDLDSDNDGIPDIEENGDSDNVALGADADNDGLDDAFDSVNDSGMVGSTVNDGINPPSALNLGDSDLDLSTGGDLDYRDIPGFDTDNDGVADVDDLDDDNDGIIDVIENGNCDITDKEEIDILYSEDFGTGTAREMDSNNNVKNHLYDNENAIPDGSYAIVSSLSTGLAQYNRTDQNSNLDANIDQYSGPSGGSSNGRYLSINMINTGNTEFYRQSLNNLIIGADYRYRIDMAGLCNNCADIPIFRLEIQNNIGTVLHSVSSASLGIANNDIWERVILNFTATTNSVDIVLINDQPNGSAGNDVGLDNIVFGMLQCPASYNDADGDGLPNSLDLDSDNDGIPDVIESGGTDADRDGKADGTVGSTPLTNGIPSSTTGGTGNTPTSTVDGDSLPDYLDIDADNDGIPDNVEGQTTNGYVSPSGVATSITDTNNNGVDDNYENGAIVGLDPENTDGDADPDYIDTDSDNDGVLDINENGDGDAYNATDTDGDGLVDVFDDNDDSSITGFTVNDNHNPPNAINLGDADNDATTSGDVDYRDVPGDSDNDGIVDADDLDDDNDGILDTVESGGNDPNGDEDGDGTPNYKDTTDAGNSGDGSTTNYTDSNGDGIPDVYDTDGDGVPNHLDLDSDNDGIPDVIESGGIDTDKDGRADGIVGTAGNTEGIPSTANTGNTPTSTVDGDAIPDYLDIDADNDGIPDNVEGQTTSGYVAPSGVGSDMTDSNNNGLDDNYETGGNIGLDQINTDGTDEPDYIDTDSDNDGIIDISENGDTDNTLANSDSDGDGLDDNFDDNDDSGTNGFTVNDNHNPPNASNLGDSDSDLANGGDVDYRDIPGLDSDNDGIANVDDLDDDNDGILDSIECAANTTQLNITGDDTASATGGYPISATVTATDGNAGETLGTFNIATTLGANDVYDTCELFFTAANFDDGLQVSINGSKILEFNQYHWDTGTGASTTEFNGASARFDSDGNGLWTPWTGEGNPILIIQGTSIKLMVDTDSGGREDALPFMDPTNVPGDWTFSSSFSYDCSAGVTVQFGNSNHSGPGAITTGQMRVDVYACIDSDGDGIPNSLDLDSDNDGIPDVIEAGGIDVDRDGRADGTVGTTVTTNGIPSSANTGLTPINSDGDSINDYLDIDADNDGIPDNIEGQTTNGYIAPSGIGNGITDVNNNGVDDNYETGGFVGLDPTDTDTDGKPDFKDADSDNDGIADIAENGDTDNVLSGGDADGDGLYDIFDDNNDSGISGSTVNDNHNPPAPGNLGDEDSDINTGGDLDYRDITGLDKDNDGIPDSTDLDDDNDGILDITESGGNDPDGDEDGDGTPNYKDTADAGNSGDGSTTNYTDSNGDGIPDVYDTDGDGIPNHLDIDADNDGIPDVTESGGIDLNNDGRADGVVGTTVSTKGIPSTASTGNDPTDVDNDGVDNYLDIDSDNDGIPDNIEAQSTKGYNAPSGTGSSVVDVNENGLDDNYETATLIGLNPENTDSVDNPDYLDSDSDNDGILDIAENGDTDNVLSGGDADGDGLYDIFDDNTDVAGDGFTVNDNHNPPAPSNLDDTDNDYNSPLGDVDYRDTLAGQGIPMITQVYQFGTERWIEITNISTTNSISSNLINIQLYKDKSGDQTGVLPDTSFTLLSDLLPGQSVIFKTSTSVISNINNSAVVLENNQLTRLENNNDIITLSSKNDTSSWENRYDVIANISDKTSYVRIDETLSPNINYDSAEWVVFVDDNLDPYRLLGAGGAERHPHAPLISEIDNSGTEMNTRLGLHRIDITTRTAGSWSNGVPDRSRFVVIDEDYNHTSSRLSARKLTVNASNKLGITNNLLVVTNNVVLNGDIRLIDVSGESKAQLIQTHESASLVTGTGRLLVDQNSTVPSLYRYNYIGSPVVASSGDSTYTVGDVLKDGTSPTDFNSDIGTSIAKDITWVGGFDGDITDPISLANYWVYTYAANGGTRSTWAHKYDHLTIPNTDGFIFKGPGRVQNYTFLGLPKDGNITTAIGGEQSYLIANPFASAISVKEFIEDNDDSITGTLYFWEHAGENSTEGDTTGHNFTGYIGGYATRTINAGVSAKNVAGAEGVVDHTIEAENSDPNKVEILGDVQQVLDESDPDPINHQNIDVVRMDAINEFVKFKNITKGVDTLRIRYSSVNNKNITLKIEGNYTKTYDIELESTLLNEFNIIELDYCVEVHDDITITSKDTNLIDIDYLNLFDQGGGTKCAPNLGGSDITYTEPKPYISIGQGFFVEGDSNGGTITFNNSQREYKDETTESVFLKSNKKNSFKELSIIKLGMNFNSISNENKLYHRQLAISFSPYQTFGYDKGYDAEIYDVGNTDFYWKFPSDDRKFVISGVQSISNDLEVPLEIVMGYSGSVSITVDEMKNITDKVYITDKLSGESYEIINNKANLTLEEGTYSDRFVLAFKPSSALSTEDDILNGFTNIYADNLNKQLVISKKESIFIEQVEMYSILGRKVSSWEITEQKDKLELKIKEQLPTGFYIVKMKTDKGEVSKKIIIE